MKLYVDGVRGCGYSIFLKKDNEEPKQVTKVIFPTRKMAEETLAETRKQLRSI